MGQPTPAYGRASATKTGVLNKADFAEFEAKTREVTFTVAAADSSEAAKKAADYVCDGTSDEVEIQAALDACLYSASTDQYGNYLYQGGRVILLDGHYNLGTFIAVYRSNILDGQGTGTVLQPQAGFADYFMIRMASGEVRNIRFDGAKESPNSRRVGGIWTGMWDTGDFTAYGMRIHNCQFWHMWYPSICVTGQDGMWITKNQFWRNETALMPAVTYPASGLGSTLGVDWSYSGYQQFSADILMKLGHFCYIYDNQMVGDDAIYHGIADVQGMISCVIARNDFEAYHNAIHGLFGALSTWDASGAAPAETVIANNIIAKHNGYGIYITNSVGLNVHDNIFRECALGFIYIGNSAHCSIHHNTFADWLDDGATQYRRTPWVFDISDDPLNDFDISSNRIMCCEPAAQDEIYSLVLGAATTYTLTYAGGAATLTRNVSGETSGALQTAIRAMHADFNYGSWWDGYYNATVTGAGTSGDPFIITVPKHALAKLTLDSPHTLTHTQHGSAMRLFRWYPNTFGAIGSNQKNCKIFDNHSEFFQQISGASATALMEAQPATGSLQTITPDSQPDCCRCVTLTSTAVPSYSNTYGTGNRLSSVTVTTNITLYPYPQYGLITGLVDGVNTAHGGEDPNFQSVGASGKYVSFQFPASQIVSEIKWYQSNTGSHGTWRIEGSANGSSWTQISDNFTLGGTATQTIAVSLSGVVNATGYVYYRFYGVSGSVSASPYIYEVEFKIAAAAGLSGTSAVTGTRGGMIVTESVSFAAGTTTTANAFDSITSYTVPASPYTGSLSLGTANIIGLQNQVYALADVYNVHSSGAAITPTAVNLDYRTVSVPLDVGPDDLQIWYRSNRNSIHWRGVN
jgi:hypothetical protein